MSKSARRVKPLAPLTPATAAPEAGSKKSWRLALAMAWFDLRRHKTRSVLTAMLIVIPVMLLTVVFTVSASRDASPDLRYGHTEFALNPDYTLQDQLDKQRADPDYQPPSDSPLAYSEHKSAADRAGHLQMLAHQTGADWVPIATQSATGTADTGDVAVGITQVSPPHGTAGRAFLTSGRWPNAPDELLATPAADTLGLTESDTVTLHVGGEPTTFTLVGTGYGSYGNEPAEFIGLIDLTSPKIHTASWLLSPDETCSIELHQNTLALPVSEHVATSPCGDDDALGSAGMPQAQASMQLSQATTLVFQILIGFPLWFGMWLICGLMVAPSFAFAALAQETLFRRLKEIGATRGQRQLVLVTQSFVLATAALAVAIPAGLGIAALIVAWLASPERGSWNLTFTVPTLVLWLIVLVVMPSCLLSAAWVSRLGVQPRQGWSWRLFWPLIAVFGVFTMCYCLWGAIEFSLLTALVTTVATITVAIVVVALIRFIGHAAARRHGRTELYHLTLLSRTSPIMLAMCCLAAFATALVTIASSVLASQNVQGNPYGVAAGESRVDYTLTSPDGEPASWLPAAATTRRLLPGADLAPVQTNDRASTTTAARSMIITYGPCPGVEPPDEPAPKRGGPRPHQGCVTRGYPGHSGPPLSIVDQNALQARFSLDDNAINKLLDGAVLYVGPHPAPTTATRYISLSERTGDRWDLEVEQQTTIDVVPVISPQETPELMVVDQLAAALDVDTTMSHVVAWHPDRILTAKDALRVENQSQAIFLRVPPEPATWSPWLVLAGGSVALIGFITVALTLHRKHHGPAYVSIQLLGCPPRYVAFLQALLAWVICTVGFLAAIVFVVLTSHLPNEFAADGLQPLWHLSAFGATADLSWTMLWQAAAFLTVVPLITATATFGLACRTTTQEVLSRGI